MSSGTAPFIVALDVGTSSVRTLLFDSKGKQQHDFGEQAAYHITTTPDGGVEMDADVLADLCERVLNTMHGHLQAQGVKAAAVAFDAFWHSFLGVNADGKPTTPIVHLFDTRSAPQVEQLARKLDAQKVHANTGCRLYTSYWPAKLLWLSQERKQQFAATRRWISFGSYLYWKLFGKYAESTSMMSGSGLWNQAANTYDGEVLSALPVQPEQLFPPGDMDEAQSELVESYRSRWPLLSGIPWFPALGDGACNNIGSGCTEADTFALMVGTSGAMRAVLKQDTVAIPDGLWCYRIDRHRYVLGGALSNGGEVYAWMRRTLNLPDPDACEKALREAVPGAHGLVLLPFFAGERSPYWRADLRAAIVGMNLSTTPTEILQAALESVALRFREIFELMQGGLGKPKQVITSGGALAHSAAWSQMMADALGVPALPCLEPEATGRGAALLAFERLGLIKDICTVPPDFGPVISPRPEYAGKYGEMLAAQHKLYQQIFSGEK